MEIKTYSLQNGILVLHPIGRLDLLSASELKRQLTQFVSEGHSRLLVDLNEVPFVDSTGLGALVSGLKAAREVGGDLRLSRPGDQARVVLELTTLDRVLQSYDTVEEALAKY